MKQILFALLLFSANSFAGTVILEGNVPEGVVFKKAFAYYKYNNCPYFCHDNSVDGKLTVKGKKFKLSIPFKEKIRLTSFKSIQVEFVMQTKSGEKKFDYYLPFIANASPDLVVDAYHISCKMKLQAYPHWHTEASGCSSPQVQIGFKTTTTIKNVTLSLDENQFEDGAVLVDEVFPGGYAVKIFDNGINGVGIRSKLSLQHKVSNAFMPKGQYRISDVNLTSDGSQILYAKVFSNNYKNEGYFTSAPLHPAQNTYVIPTAEIRAKCPQAKMAWIMKKRSDDGNDKVEVTCL
jgi:hypothetical protein